MTAGSVAPRTTNAPAKPHVITVRRRLGVTVPTRRLAEEITRSSTIAMITMAMPALKAAPTLSTTSALTTTWPSPGVATSAATVTIESAAITVWLTPTMRVRRDMGSCTPKSTCRVVAPSDRLASTDSGATSRIPTAVSRMTGGTAYTSVATMPLGGPMRKNSEINGR